MKRVKLKKHNSFLFIFSFILIICYLIYNRVSFIKPILNMMLENDIKLYGNSFDDIIYLMVNPFYYTSDNKVENADVDLYIYNTHDHEKYLDSYGVLEASHLIKEKLNIYGIKTVIEKEKVSPYIPNDGNFFDEYTVSRKYLEDVIKTYPNLKLIIDLHRDGLERENTYVKIGDKVYAKILFVQGVRYENYEVNLSLAKKISNMFDINYKGVSRGILLKDKEYQHDNYNQDLNLNAILLELGSNNNTWEEVCNTIDVLVPILKEIIYEEENI